MERDKLKKIGMGWTNFTPVAMEPKKEGFRKRLDFFHQISWSFVGIATIECGSYWGLKQFKMAAVAMVNQGANNVKFTPNFTIFLHLRFLSHPRLVERDRLKKNIGIGRTNFAAVAMEIKKEGFKFFFSFFHQTSWNIVGTKRNWWNLIGTTSTSSGTR